MMAAHDTSTSTLTTMAYHLAANPEWQDRVRDESDRLGDGPLDIEALDKLETLDLVINEALRLVTPLPMNIRRTVRDTELCGYFIPANTNVVTWPSMNHHAFAPFGGGAHKCIGMVFGQLEIKTVMHRLLRRYRLELPRPGYKASWDYGGMPVPMDGMPIVLRPLH
jgi:cytochrome P450